jgi:hypothetical protein
MHLITDSRITEKLPDLPALCNQIDERTRLKRGDLSDLWSDYMQPEGHVLWVNSIAICNFSSSHKLTLEMLT